MTSAWNLCRALSGSASPAEQSPSVRRDLFGAQSGSAPRVGAELDCPRTLS